MTHCVFPGPRNHLLTLKLGAGQTIGGEITDLECVIRSIYEREVVSHVGQIFQQPDRDRGFGRAGLADRSR